MTNAELEPFAASDLLINPDQGFWTDKQKAALAQLGVANASNADLAVFFHHVRRTGLDPFAKQIYMLQREGKQTIQTGIDGFRLIARRAVDEHRETLGYEETQWCGDDGQWRDVWLDGKPPAAAAVVVLRNGNRFPAIALYSEYVGRKRDGSVNRVWQEKPALMLAKCAEALALRKAFPQDLSGLYTSDEMKADRPPEATWDAEVVEDQPKPPQLHIRHKDGSREPLEPPDKPAEEQPPLVDAFPDEPKESKP